MRGAEPLASLLGVPLTFDLASSRRAARARPAAAGRPRKA
jgi:hypothetical protein